MYWRNASWSSGWIRFADIQRKVTFGYLIESSLRLRLLTGIVSRSKMTAIQSPSLRIFSSSWMESAGTVKKWCWFSNVHKLVHSWAFAFRTRIFFFIPNLLSRGLHLAGLESPSTKNRARPVPWTFKDKKWVQNGLMVVWVSTFRYVIYLKSNKISLFIKPKNVSVSQTIRPINAKGR